MAGFAIMVAPLMTERPRSLALTHLMPEQIGKNRRALPDDDGLTIAQGIPSVGAAVHISVDHVVPGQRRVGPDTLMFAPLLRRRHHELRAGADAGRPALRHRLLPRVETHAFGAVNV